MAVGETSFVTISITAVSMLSCISLHKVRIGNSNDRPTQSEDHPQGRQSKQNHA